MPRRKPRTADSWDDEDFPPAGPEAIHALTELERARQALASGDLAHAALHAASALASDPIDPQHLALLDEVIARAASGPPTQGPEALFCLDGREPSFVLVAGRAYVDAVQGRLTEALERLYRVLAVRPEVDYHAWARRWLQAEGAAARLDADTVAEGIYGWVVSFGGLTVEDPQARRLLERGLPVVDAVVGAQPGSALMRVTRAVLVRKLGRPEESLSEAREAFALQASVPALVAEAMAQRALGQTDETVAVFRRALELDPENLAIRLDVGDVLLDAGRAAAALQAYREVLERELHHAWAEPSALYCQFALDDDRRSLTRLRTLARRHPGERASALLERVAAPTPRRRRRPAPG